MAVENGFGKVVTSGSVFMYDTGDTINSYLGEPTTNVFKHYGTTGQGSAADNNVNFEVNGDGIFIRLGYGQTFGGYTIQPNDVVYKYNLGGYGCHYHGNDVFVPSGTYVTFTFDYYISPGAGGYPETNYLANMETGTGAGTGIASPNNLTGVWQTISVTTGPTTSGGNLRPLLYPGACGGRLASSGYILFKNPQVEYKPHKTPFTQTSRSVSGSLLPLVGNSTLNLSSVSFDSNAQIIFDGTDDYIPVSDIPFRFTNIFTLDAWVYFNGNDMNGNIVSKRNGSPFNQYGISIYSGNPYLGGIGKVATFFGREDAGSGTADIILNYLLPSAGFYNIVASINTTSQTLYVNRVARATTSVNISSNTYNITGRDLLIGAARSNDGTGIIGPFLGTIPVVKIYNRALSAAEVQQNYNKYKSRFNLP